MQQNITDIDGTDAILTIIQHLQPTTYDKDIEFLVKFKSLYTGLLNDIRVLYLPYIQLSSDPIDRNITTKELVKLKFFHLMNFIVFLQNNPDYLAEIIALEGLLSQISGGNLNDFTDSDAGKVEKKMGEWLGLFFSTDDKEVI